MTRCPRCGRSTAWCHCTESQLRRAKVEHWLDPVPRRWDTERRFDEAIEEKRREERARERREEEARDRAHHELMERRRAEAREASATAEYERRLCGDDDAHEAADAHLDPDHGVHSGQ